MILLDGKTLSEKIINEIAKETEELSSNGKRPGLAVVMAGDNPASSVYVANKERSAKKAGFLFQKVLFSSSVSDKEIKTVIEDLNSDERFHGIIVQLPLPEHLDENEIISSISPQKDVDGLTPLNLGRLVLEEDCFIPCTPQGVMAILNEYKIDTKGKHAVVIGRSNIVGKPMALLLSAKSRGNSTVTICHSATKNLKEICRTADILIAALGRPLFVTRDFIKEGATIIDVGINRVLDPSKPSGTKLVGDVDFNDVKEICYAITPVPGGIGPMTVAMLLNNTLLSFKKHVY